MLRFHIFLRAFSVLIVFMVLLVRPAEAANVIVHISNVETSKGVIRVFVCLPGEFLTENCTYKLASSAKAGAMKLVVKNVEPGTYAIEAYQDENNDGKMDMGFLGLFPQEGYGFSRLGRVYSTPSFEDACIPVKDPETSVEISLNYP